MMVDCKCANKKCGMPFKARSADVKRGWGKFCSKSCKAAEQESRTHQNANYQHCRVVASYEREFGGTACFDNRGRYAGFTDHFSEEFA